MNKTVALVMGAIALLAGVASAEDPVYFEDATLKAVVEDALWVSDPTATDMLGLISLTAGSQEISSATGLEYATNLTSLQLPCNWIISISPLSGLTNLQKLVINNNSISNISPLSGMTYLEHLDMHDNYVLSNISSLAGLTNLRTIILRGNSITSVSALSGLSSLQTLHLEHNEISDISPLTGLTSLVSLDLRDNPLNDAAYSTYIPQIFANNPGISFSYPARPSTFVISSTTGGSVIDPGEGEFLFEGVTSVTLEAQAEPGFVFVNFSGSVFTTDNPVDIRVDQDHAIIANFVSEAGTPGDPGTGPAGEDPVYFKDDTLLAAVEDALGISDPTPTDMLTLTGLTATSQGIRSITGLEYATNLTSLKLSSNLIDDIAEVSSLVNLETLRLEYNEISEISPLAGLTALTVLDLRDNPLNDDAYDVYIPQILANNPGINLNHPASLFSFVLSSTAGGSIINPGEGALFFDTSYVFIEAQADPGFVFTGFTGTLSTTQNPVQVPVNQDHQILANFASVQDTVYVDDDAAGDVGPGDGAVSDPLEDGTSEHPFDSIQEAIEVAAAGNSIVVRPGTYTENISLLGKSVHLTGMEFNDPNVSDYPVIDGANNGPVVRFTQGEDPNCTLSGFILSSGLGQSAAAVLCMDSSPTMANCVIVGNRTRASEGAAIYCDNSQATLINCTVADNHGGKQGAGLRLVDSNIAILNTILWENGTDEIVLDEDSSVSVGYTNLVGGWAGAGNMDADPLFALRGYWTDPDDAEIAMDPSQLTAVWTSGDYHLISQGGRWDVLTQAWIVDDVTSPCIDAGDPLESSGEETDPNSLINMGAYGGTGQASRSYWP